MKYQILVSIFFCSLFISNSCFSEEEPTKIPKRSVRVYAIEKSDLVKETSSFDELDKDMLVFRAKNESLEKLKSKYPNLTPGKLQKLQGLMQKGTE